MKNKIIRCILDADLRCSHDGLSAFLKNQFKVDTEKLETGEFIVFLNSARTIVKIFAANNIIAHYKSRRGKIDLRTLQHIPKYFNGTAFDFDAALAETLRDNLKASKDE